MPKSGPGWLFVYGTLRPHRDAYNAGMLAGYVDKVIHKAQAHGTIHFVSRSGGYPVAFFDSDTEDLIIGDLLHVEDLAAPPVQRVHRMEVGAGYRMVTVECVTPDGETIEATAYHYEYEPEGPRIACGDWLAAVTNG
jgi:gamma-glutamylcyclotransferase (GGCT)/AIG2-like uncharacterized protein YtfP